ncbi:MAG: thioesterase family protein [Bacteroidales bacterium]|jgi:predicted thioesterase|nr:thioesterase family protein [Bacteroidales bacterium]HNX84045.1 thioesterase family protein [Bacteroidales bacterium]HOC47507.1 thioesterase family protein [Bacteroidales bacterium]HPS97964.1 thioesterase family protein [Bacteroidales bacterium]
MSQILVPGIRLTTTRTVSTNDTAAVYGSGLHDVLSTPAMIAFMEQTAMKAVEACLDEGEGTVGTEVNIRHLKATPVGKTITCTATLQEVNGNRLLFHVEADDETGKIGEGKHERFIIDNRRFKEKLNG